MMAPAASRTPELNRRNRRVALIVVLVWLVVTIGSIIYIMTLGGANKGPLQPFHSHGHHPLPSPLST